MPAVLAVIALHVGMGLLWLIATAVTSVRGRVGRLGLPILLGAAGLNMLAGIYLWHALHGGAWGRTEHLLATGTFCAFVALGIQVPIVLTAPKESRLAPPALGVYRVTSIFIFAAAAAMVAARLPG